MMLVGDKVVSEEIFEEQFVCDLNACKGACCVEGDSGAPLEFDELHKLDDNLEAVLPYLPKKGRKALKKHGPYVVDAWGEYTTTLVAPGKECAFTVFEKNGMAKCGIELAWKDGKSDFRKPISCHLYPIRVAHLGENDALNYDRWSICSAACSLGAALKVPVFKFLEEPLITKYGKAFYKELTEVGEAYLKYRESQVSEDREDL